MSGFRHDWTGWNDSTFNLTEFGGANVWLHAGGIEGLGFAKSDDYTSASPALDGQRYVDSRQLPRDVFWPVVVDGTDGGWFALQREFWTSLHPGRYGVWRVTAPDGSYRELTCRLVDDNAVYEYDPDVKELEVRGVVLIADDPAWHGPEVVATFQTAENAQDYYAPPGSAYVYFIGSAHTVASASVTNPGDDDAWPLWTVIGPAIGFSLVDGNGATTSATMEIDAGEWLEIDTDPTVQTARLFTAPGVSTIVPFDEFTSIEFARIPAGVDVPLDVVLNGAGSVKVAFHPPYRRAF